MNYESVKKNILEKYEKRTTQRSTKIYSQRESSDSPGSFEFERTRKIDRRDL